MGNHVRKPLLIAAAAVAAALAVAQEPLRGTRTIQERVTDLEATVATIETRLGLERSRPAPLGTGESGQALAARVDSLERSLERLASDLQRVERLADNASREAAQAARDASAAQQAARDAALRAR
jgi:hypothetical protein